jgi:dipeptidase E
MAKLIMFSSLTPFARQEANKVIKMLPEISGKSYLLVGYLPCSEEVFYDHLQEAAVLKYYFETHNIGTVQVVWENDEDLIQYDAIVLPGGNTFEILRYLKNSGYFYKLKEFANQDRVLIGKSAGSIIMTPTIKIAQFADDNEDEYNDLKALNLVDFEVKPHWDKWKNKKQVFRDYMELHNTTLYGIPEGEAIVVSNSDVKFTSGIVKIA